MNSTQTGHSDTTTDGIRVRVAAEFDEAHSAPDSGQWGYRYRVVLSNEGNRPARLVSRHWVIRDANNQAEVVEGDGVIGEQPRLEPGNRHEYESFCPLQTSWGTMEGSYKMQWDDGAAFEVAIGRFFLAQTAAPISALDES